MTHCRSEADARRGKKRKKKRRYAGQVEQQRQQRRRRLLSTPRPRSTPTIPPLPSSSAGAKGGIGGGQAPGSLLLPLSPFLLRSTVRTYTAFFVNAGRRLFSPFSLLLFLRLLLLLHARPSDSHGAKREAGGDRRRRMEHKGYLSPLEILPPSIFLIFGSGLRKKRGSRRGWWDHRPLSPIARAREKRAVPDPCLPPRVGFASCFFFFDRLRNKDLLAANSDAILLVDDASAAP